MTGSSTGKRVVIATFGSLGDLHPYLAIGQELQTRGHDVVLATSAFYREAIEGLGLGFHPVRPDFAEHLKDPEVYRKAMDLKTGSEYVIRVLVTPHVRDSYEDLLEAARGTDLLVSHMITFAAPIVAEVLELPWVSTVLAPFGFLSAWDPPVSPASTAFKHLRVLGPRVLTTILRWIKNYTIPWAQPVAQLRAELGLPPGRNPLFEGQQSPYGTLALFSEVLGKPQPDWPSPVIQTGFPFFDRIEGKGLSPELERFLQAGPPPIVFTLGSSAVNDAGSFYAESRAAAERLNRRAVFLIGKDPRNQPSTPLPESIAAFDYAPYSELFPRAAAIVHQGGVGTTAQALRSGRPTLVVPWSHDQPDNAERVMKLGVARTIPRRKYNAHSAFRSLERLLNHPSYATCAEEIGRKVRSEAGAEAAAAAIDHAMTSSASHSIPGRR